MVYLKEVFEVPGSKTLHLRHIVGKLMDGIFSKWSDQMKSDIVGIFSVIW